MYKDNEYEKLRKETYARLDCHEDIICMVCFQYHSSPNCLQITTPAPALINTNDDVIRLKDKTSKSITSQKSDNSQKSNQTKNSVGKNENGVGKNEISVGNSKNSVGNEDDETAEIFCPNCGCSDHHCDFPPIDGYSYNLCNAPKYEAYNRFNSCKLS